MKGAELTTSTIILIILGIIVLVSFILFILGSKGTVDAISAREALRNCCGDRSIYKCDGDTSVLCKVSWSDTPEKISDIMTTVGITTEDQLNAFCFCPATST